MSNIRQIFACAKINFRKWTNTPRIFVAVAALLLLTASNYQGYAPFCAATHTRISIWLLPIALGGSTITIMLYGLFNIFLFCDAPFNDAQMPFVMVRTGKRNWILGQLLYIGVTAFAMVLVVWIGALLPLLPYLGFSTNWGSVIETVAKNSSLLREYGAEIVGAAFDPRLIEKYGAIEATLLSALLMWLVSFFTGTLIMACNIVIRPGSGNIIAGVLIIFTSFSQFIGIALWGETVAYFTPYLWAALQSYHLMLFSVPVSYAVGALGFAVVFLSSVSVIVFCRKDTDIQKGGRK